MKEYKDYEAKAVHCGGIVEDYEEDKKYFKDRLLETCAPNTPKEFNYEFVEPNPGAGQVL